MKNASLLAVISACLFASCSTSPYEPGPAPDKMNDLVAGPYNLGVIMAELSPQPKTEKFDVAKGANFRGNSGTRYEFPPNAFVDETGAPVTGIVEVQVTEMLTKTDMVFSGVVPVADDEPLVSGGEVQVTAQQEGRELKMAPGVPFKASMPMPGTNATDMELFVGNATGNKSTATVKVNWRKPDTAWAQKNKIFTLGDTIGISSTTIKYCNADRFMKNPINYQKFWLQIDPDGLTYSEDSMIINTFYDEFKGVWPMRYKNGGANHLYEEGHVPDIPVHFVVFTLIKGNFYGAILGATPKTGEIYHLKLEKVDPQDFKARVAALN